MGFRLGVSFVDFCVDFCAKAHKTRGKKLFTGSYGTRCTDRNGNKVSSYPYEGVGNNSYGTRCTDRNDNKVPSYPYKRRVKALLADGVRIKMLVKSYLIRTNGQ